MPVIIRRLEDESGVSIVQVTNGNEGPEVFVPMGEIPLLIENLGLQYPRWQASGVLLLIDFNNKQTNYCC